MKIKSVAYTLSALSLALTILIIATSFYASKRNEIHNSAQLASKVIYALQENSFDQYQQLFPSIDEFMQIMETSNIYGLYLKETKFDFEITYKENLLPTFQNSFITLIKEGKNNGIDWNTVKFKSTTTVRPSVGHPTYITLIIEFVSNGKDYRIEMNRAVILNGQWRVSPFAKFI